MHEVGAPDHPREVAQLADEVVGVRLEEQRDVDVRADRADRVVEVEEVALEQRQPRRREHDPPPAHGQQAARTRTSSRRTNEASRYSSWLTGGRPRGRRLPGPRGRRDRRLAGTVPGSAGSTTSGGVSASWRRTSRTWPVRSDRISRSVATATASEPSRPSGDSPGNGLAPHRRVGALGADGVDPDPLVGPLLGQALGHVDQRRLARRIGDVVGAAARERARREHRQRPARCRAGTGRPRGRR